MWMQGGYLHIHEPLLVWNVRGLNHPSKQKEVQRIVREKKITLICIIETRVKCNKADVLMESLFPNWGFCSNYEQHHLGRIWVCWDKLDFDVCTLDKTD